MPELIEVAGIPYVLTENHNEVLGYWLELQQRGLPLIHVDGHADMAGAGLPLPFIEGQNPHQYASKIGIGSFICPAFHVGVVSDVYWVNPHSKTIDAYYPKTLWNKGLRTHVTYDGLRWGSKRKWEMHTKGKLIQPDLLPTRAPILDIDLDAFCCDKPVGRMSVDYTGVTGWESRIAWVEECLFGIARPALITVTSSQGPPSSARYVPESLVAPVECAVKEMLHRLYG